MPETDMINTLIRMCSGSERYRGRRRPTKAKARKGYQSWGHGQDVVPKAPHIPGLRDMGTVYRSRNSLRHKESMRTLAVSVAVVAVLCGAWFAGVGLSR